MQRSRPTRWHLRISRNVDIPLHRWLPQGNTENSIRCPSSTDASDGRKQSATTAGQKRSTTTSPPPVEFTGPHLTARVLRLQPWNQIQSSRSVWTTSQLFAASCCNRSLDCSRRTAVKLVLCSRWVYFEFTVLLFRTVQEMTLWLNAFPEVKAGVVGQKS